MTPSANGVWNSQATPWIICKLNDSKSCSYFFHRRRPSDLQDNDNGNMDGDLVYGKYRHGDRDCGYILVRHTLNILDNLQGMWNVAICGDGGKVRAWRKIGSLLKVVIPGLNFLTKQDFSHDSFFICVTVRNYPLQSNPQVKRKSSEKFCSVKKFHLAKKTKDYRDGKKIGNPSAFWHKWTRCWKAVVFHYIVEIGGTPRVNRIYKAVDVHKLS